MSIDLTAPVVEAATSFISDAGLPAVAILMAAESACLPVPSEAIMLFAGFSVSKGELSMAGIVAAGVLGNLLGSWVAYGAGYYGRVRLFESGRLGLRHAGRHLRRADRWFERYGAAAVFFTRMLPIVRTFVSLPAGIARMPFWRFTVLTIAGCIPWVLMLALVGREVGANWERWRETLHYVDYALIAFALAASAIWLWRRRAARKLAG